MYLKSVIVLRVSAKYASTSSSICRYLSKVLDDLKIPFECSVETVQVQHEDLSLEANYYLVFQLNRELHYTESAHYISQIIEGQCGILCLVDPDCYDYSYRLFVSD